MRFIELNLFTKQQFCCCNPFTEIIDDSIPKEDRK